MSLSLCPITKTCLRYLGLMNFASSFALNKAKRRIHKAFSNWVHIVSLTKKSDDRVKALHVST